MWENIKHGFYLNFIKENRYQWLLDGLKTTLEITVFAVIIGVIIGFIVAIIRSAHDKNGKFRFLNGIDPNIKMRVDTFCKSHCSRMSDNLPDGHFLS